VNERAKRILMNVGLVLVAATLTLGFLEIIFRILRHGRGGGKEERTTALYTEYDPILGWRKTPGGRATFNRREYRVQAVINSHGLRDSEHEYQAPPGTFRIMSLGDSFVEGYGVEAKDTATEGLETTLSTPGCPLEAINAGTIGYGTDQEYLFYTEEGVKYSPHVVLLFFYYNDVRFNVADWYFGLPKPRLIRKGDSLQMRFKPLPEGPFERAQNKKWKQRRQQAAAPEPEEASALLEFVKDRLMRGAPQTYNALGRLGLWQPMRVVPPKPEMQVYWQDAPPYYDKAWKATADIIQALDTQVRARGARLLVVYVPSRMEVNDRDWELTRVQYGLDERWDRGLAREQLLAIAKAGDVPVLDLTDALRRADRGALGGPYYVYDGHWKPDGHRIAAREIASYLRAHSWLPACAGKGP